MRYYELLYIINPNLEDDRINAIIDEIGNEVSKFKVSIINHNLWGKKRLAYPIKNNKYGTYILLQFSSEQFDFLIEFERSLILNKSIIRHQLVRLDEEPPKVENIEAVIDNADLLDGKEADVPKDDSNIDQDDSEIIEVLEKTEVVEKVEKVEEIEVAEKTEDIDNIDDNDVEKSVDEKKNKEEKKEEDK
ncbi:30S ribosomal protein S6 [Candidatus Neomarinimicrobiota bacterium]